MAFTWTRRLCAAAAVLFASASSAFAGDFNPPPWRGAPLSTWQIWGFGAPDPIPQPPDQWFQNPPLSFPAGMLPQGAMGMDPEWLPTVGTPGGGASGVWCLWPMEALCFRVPNYDNHNPYKLVRIQIKYFNPENTTGGPPVPPLIEIGPDVVPSEIIPLGSAAEPIDPSGLGFWNLSFDFEIRPNPAEEFIYIRNGKNSQIYIDQVVIDTICVPGAPAFGLAAVAGLAAFRRRRA